MSADICDVLRKWRAFEQDCQRIAMIIPILALDDREVFLPFKTLPRSSLAMQYVFPREEETLAHQRKK